MFEVLLVLISMLVVALLFWLWLVWSFKYWERRGIEHDKPRIPSGNVHEWLRTRHLAHILSDTYKKYRGKAPYAGFYFNTQKAAVILDLELAKRILEEDFQYFEKRGYFNNALDDPLTGNLFLLDGHEWRTLKERICPLFEFHRIREIYSSVLEVGVELQRVFDGIVRESPGGIMEITNIANRYVMDVISNTVFGQNCNSLTDPATPFFENARIFFSKRRHDPLVDSLINCYPGWAKAFRMKIIPEEVTDFYMGFIDKMINWRAERGTRKHDFLNLLINLRNQGNAYGTGRITFDELCAQCFSFFITTFDSCSATISYLLLELAANNELQYRLRADIYQNLVRYGHLTFECLQDMKLLDRMIKETLRKYPVIPVLFRKCTKRYEPASFPDYYIEKGCTVIIPIQSYHNDPVYFPDPEEFRPDRFTYPNIRFFREGSYLPFGAGPRTCIGSRIGEMIVKIAVVKLIERYKFSTCSHTELPVPLAVRSFNLQPYNLTLQVSRA